MQNGCINENKIHYMGKFLYKPNWIGKNIFNLFKTFADLLRPGFNSNKIYDNDK